MPEPRFRTPLYYKLVRHPIYLGFIVAFWRTLTMTVGHLLFATVTTAYILIGICLEEHDLVDLFGDEYRRYGGRSRVLVPWRKSGDVPPASRPPGRDCNSALRSQTIRGGLVAPELRRNTGACRVFRSAAVALAPRNRSSAALSGATATG